MSSANVAYTSTHNDTSIIFGSLLFKQKYTSTKHETMNDMVEKNLRKKNHFEEYHVVDRFFFPLI